MLKIHNISKTFNPGTVNEKQALSNLSLHLDKGDFVTIFAEIGESAGHEVEEGCAQAVNIAADIGGLTVKLFRTDVLGGAHNFIAVIIHHGTGGDPCL